MFIYNKKVYFFNYALLRSAYIINTLSFKFIKAINLIYNINSIMLFIYK
jgi:hypothetical protein